MQGAHQVAQKSRITHFPRKSESFTELPCASWSCHPPYTWTTSQREPLRAALAPSVTEAAARLPGAPDVRRLDQVFLPLFEKE